MSPLFDVRRQQSVYVLRAVGHVGPFPRFVFFYQSCSFVSESFDDEINQGCSIRHALSLPCVAFMSAALARKMSPEVVSDIVKGLRQSSLRQYESCWKAFQSYLQTHNDSVTTQDIQAYMFYVLFEKEGNSDCIYTFVRLDSPSSFWVQHTFGSEMSVQVDLQ